MELTISTVDYAPPELEPQLPVRATLVRELPGPDRPDYWLCTVAVPLHWIHDNQERSVSHIILAARWVGTRIEPGVHQLPVGIAYVTDPSLLSDNALDLKKCEYIAIGIADDTTSGEPPRPLTSVLSGRIRALFGLAKPS